jgi:hypothetical protein
MVYRLFLVIAWMMVSPVYGVMMPLVQDVPIHEAYLLKVSGNLVEDAVPAAPPTPIRENIPESIDPTAIWIPGYWAWISEIDDFKWVCGVWRFPPPGRVWVPGGWEEFEDGWVWIHGFWSPIPQNQIHYYEEPPPEAVQENPETAPGPDDFWTPGYWNMGSDNKSYGWAPGRWQPFDPDWIYVPAHYVWRPNGYVFVPPYWDYPLDQRGNLYNCVEPLAIIDPDIVVRRIFVDYPDYSYFFVYHHHFHPDFWTGCGCVPPWWYWNSWWSFTPYQHWGLWWWYTHPGYPQPVWLHAKVAQEIAPPSLALVDLFKRVHQPAYVTPHGVIPPHRLLEAVQSYNGKNAHPILPKNLSERTRILSTTIPHETGKILQPSGKKVLPSKLAKNPIPRPEFNPEELKNAPKVKNANLGKVPPKPVTAKNQVKRGKPLEEKRARMRPTRETTPSTEQMEQPQPQQEGGVQTREQQIMEQEQQRKEQLLQQQQEYKQQLLQQAQTQQQQHEELQRQRETLQEQLQRQSQVHHQHLEEFHQQQLEKHQTEQRLQLEQQRQFELQQQRTEQLQQQRQQQLQQRQQQLQQERQEQLRQQQMQQHEQQLEHQEQVHQQQLQQHEQHLEHQEQLRQQQLQQHEQQLQHGEKEKENP